MTFSNIIKLVFSNFIFFYLAKCRWQLVRNHQKNKTETNIPKPR